MNKLKNKEKKFIEKVLNRLERLVMKMLSLTFLTWALVTYLCAKGKLNLEGIDYVIFTASLIGIKTYKQIKERIEEMR